MLLILKIVTIKNSTYFLLSYFFKMVTSTGFGPVNAAVKGQCVKPLHQLAKMVGLGGLEPPTSRLSGVRSNQLSYNPETNQWCPLRDSNPRPTD